MALVEASSHTGNLACRRVGHLSESEMALAEVEVLRDHWTAAAELERAVQLLEPRTVFWAA